MMNPKSNNLTDLGNAKRIVAEYGDIIKYIPEIDRFFLWTGTHWKVSSRAIIESFAKKIIPRIYHEAYTTGRTELQKEKILKHAYRSESTSKIKAMVASLKSEPTIISILETFDSHPYLLNLQNGTYDLKNFIFRSHDKNDFIRKISPAFYNKESTCPRWEAFLKNIFKYDYNLITYIQKIVGMSLTGDMSERLFFILYGSGANGKTTFLTVLSTLLGDYSTVMRPEALLRSSPSSATYTNDLADLAGCRFVSISETEEGQALKVSLIKTLTGGDKIIARRLFENNFTFHPECKIFLATNHKPVIKESIDAIWDRVRLIPFLVSIPTEKRDKELGVKLKHELSGILNWAIEGCRKWQEENLITPASIQQANNEYRSEMDIVGQFITECCTVSDVETVTISAVYEAYSQWWKDNKSGRIIGKTTFGQKLKEKGFEQHRDSKSRYWKGLSVKDEFHYFQKTSENFNIFGFSGNDKMTK